MAKFFGQYLLEKGILTREQLLEALTKQREKVEKIGELAVRKGYLKPRDIEAIQREQQKSDLYFGEAAVKLNLLTEDQVRELLNIQRSNHVYLGEIIVDLKFLSKESVEKELKRFQEEEQEGGSVGELHVPSSCAHPELLKATADLAIKLFRRVSDLLVKVSTVLDTEKVENPYSLTFINISGDFKGSLALGCSKNVVLHIAKNFGGSRLDWSSEKFAHDAVSEFFNIFCGNLMTKWMEIGKSCEISVPYFFLKTEKDGLKIENGARVFTLDLDSTEGKASVSLIPNFILEKTV